MKSWLERLFKLQQNGTSVATEVRAGVVTFLTMAYILFVNPQILAEAGMPASDVAVATALSAAVATLAMGLLANYPFALAPGMGLNAYFVYGVVEGLGVDWQVALAAVFVEGLAFLVLSLTGARSALLNAVPAPIKLAIMTGIGLFLALIGMQSSGLVTADPATLVRIGDLSKPPVLLALTATLLIAGLQTRKIPGAILIAILLAAAVAWLSGLSPAPQSWFAAPELPRETLFAWNFGSLATGSLLGAVLAFFFVDLLDTAGTLIGVGQLGGFLNRQGELPRAERAFAADALGTAVGATLGTSTVTSYVESATGIDEGGRTGLTATVVAALFAASLFLTPIFVAVPAAATAPALIVVGAMMMRGASEVDWRQPSDALPAFLTIVVMPFTFSIANGMALGLVSWVLLRLFTGRHREVSWMMYLLCALLLIFVFALHPG